MKLQWKDYKYGSWLVVKFGSVAAKIDVLGYSKAGAENNFGVISIGIPALPKISELLPGTAPGGGDYTRAQVKALVESALAPPLV